MSGKLKNLALTLFCVSVPFFIWIGIRFAPPPDPRQAVTYADLVTTLLTGITIVLALLALVIAGVAIWGYQGIRAEAKNAAQSAVRNGVEEFFKNREIQDKMVIEIDRRIEAIVKARIDAMQYSMAYEPNLTEPEARSEQRAVEDYPPDSGIGEESDNSGGAAAPPSTPDGRTGESV